jgi:transcriptional regulator with XRE-family HTH domain
MTPEALRLARALARQTQFEFGLALGVTERTVRRWEAGHCPIPRAVELVLTQRREVLAATRGN